MEADPWGFPYKLILGKLRSISCGLTETLEGGDLKRLLDSLFPVDGGPLPDAPRSLVWEWDEDSMRITLGEVQEVIRRKGGKNAAPGRDGIRMRTLKAIPEGEVSTLVTCYNRCLREGRFPEQWKCVLLVLIPKELPLDMTNPKVRPICLLSEMGKIFEAIIVERLTAWMKEHPKALKLSKSQFGFRRSKSTCDALMQVRSTIIEAEGRGEMVMAASLDIKNAFNSLPWSVIKAALRRKGFPPYLQSVIDAYLSDRSVKYVNKEGATITRRVVAGVPQGSVLGGTSATIVSSKRAQ